MKSQASPSRGLLVGAAFVLLALSPVREAAAQSTVGFQEYFVLGHEEDVWTMMNRVRTGEAAAAFPAPNRMNSVVSVTATADGQVLVYDHWEDGFEPDNDAPYVSPTTMVLGDSNNANGRACDWSVDPRVVCGTATEDQLFAGTAMALASDLGMGTIKGFGIPGTVNCAVPIAPGVPATELTQLRCSVPVVPRGTTIRFDGGDRVFNTGGSLSIAHIQDPGTSLIGGGTELISRELVKEAVSYSIPVGENLFGDPLGAYASLKYVSLDIVAFDDNTALTVNSPGFGTISMTLHKGQHYSTCATFAAGSPGLCTAGAISGPAGPGPDNRGVFPPLALTVNSGTKISATGPINALIFTGGIGSYQTRHYATLPDILHTSDYVVTAPGTTAGPGMNLYIYNPSPTASIVVTRTDSSGTSNLTILANSVVDYRTQVGAFVPGDSTVRLTSNRPFWGLSAYGITNNISDWGHAWLGVRFLTTDYTLAYSPGTQVYPVTSVTCDNATTARATTVVPNEFDNNDLLRISGASGGAAMNGTFVTTDISTTQFTYPVTACTPSVATDTIKVVGVCAASDNSLSGAGGCNSYNRDPVWVAGTQNNTQIRVDLNADGLFDFVDTNSDGCPDSGLGPVQPPGVCSSNLPAFTTANGGTCATPPTANTCVYLVNAPGAAGLDSLRIWDYTDMDNAGTRIVSSKPVAVSWGQDVDQGESNDPSPDNGYTVYPSITVDTVLGLDKAVSPARVPLGGTPAQRTVSYSLRIFSGDYGPITNLQITDILPPGIGCTDFVPGSTLITYPDLSQNSPVPTCLATVAPDPLGRFKLTWALTPNQLLINEQTLVTYQVIIPISGAARTLTNDAQATGTRGGSVFRPKDTATVAQTDTSIVKSQSNFDATPEIGETITYTLVVTNGIAVDTNITIADAIPPFTTLVPLSITSSISSGTAFTGSYSDAQNAVVWTGASFNANAVATLTFQVTINAGTPTGSIIPNTANFSSSTVPSLDSNQVQTVVVGPILTITKAGPPAPLRPNEIATFTITVNNSGSGAAPNLLLTDNLAGSNMTYVPGSMAFSLNGAAFVPLTDIVDADGGSFAGTTMSYSQLSLGAGQDLIFRFQARVNNGTGGLFATNQAQVTPSGQPSIDSNLVQIPIVGNANLTGRVFLDYNANGTQDPGEPGAVGVAVLVTDSTLGVQTVFTDANGDYLATVPAGSTTINPDQTTGNIPFGSVLTTACASGVSCPNIPNDPQTVTAVANATTAVPFVGYDPPGLLITKTTTAPAGVLRGQTVPYTITLTNASNVTQTGIRITDVIPAGTTYVGGTALVTLPGTFRVTEYPLTVAGLTGTLTLNQPLKPDYFAIVQGSDENGGTDTTPAQDYLALTNDTFGTGDFTGGIASTSLDFTRNGDATNWTGIVTVVECLRDCDVSGFRLRSVDRIDHFATSSPDTAAVSWTAANKVVLFGGANGAGCNTTDPDALDHEACHVRFSPSGTNTITWQRSYANTGTAETSTVSTVMAVEWGSQWTVQRVNVTGGNGGDGLDLAGEYNTAAIASARRANTWVWGTGFTNDPDAGESAEAAVITLGNGVAQAADELLVAVGTEQPENVVNVNFDVYVMTHPQLANDWDFKVDGDNGALTVAVPTNAATANRMALAYNGNSDTDNNYPRSIFSARYAANTSIEMARRRANSTFPAWVQGINFAPIARTITCLGVYPPTAENCTSPDVNSNIVDPTAGFTLEPGETMTVTFQVTVNANAATGPFTNTAQGDSNEEPQVVGSVIRTVVVPGVTIEPNNAGFTTPSSTITFTHEVVNRGSATDSFNVTLNNQSGWKVELIEPTTGGIIATDSDGNGTWDGGVIINTGALAPNVGTLYRVRVTVPAVAPLFKSTTELTATSVAFPTTSAVGTDEVTVLPPGGFGPVEIAPDSSGVVTAGSFTAYPMSVFNNTGAPATFDLNLASTLNWPNTLHADSNGDGLYTPGVDLAIVNTASIPNLSSQRIFVVVNAPGGAVAGSVDVSIITAVSRTNPLHYDSVTTTTRVNAPTSLDLSGGGSRVVVQNDTAVYPGVLYNLSPSSDRFNFTLSQASLFGLDGLNHPTELWLDTNGDKVPETLVATDTDGNGSWNSITGGFDVDGNNQPDIQLAGNSSLDYELVRVINGAQALPVEYVTLTATGTNSPQNDAVTALWIIASVTRASLRGLRVDAPGGVVEFATGSQRGTRAFVLYETAARRAAPWERLTEQEVLSPLPDSRDPILYRVETRPLRQPFIAIEEIETNGNRLRKGPFAINDAGLLKGLLDIERRLNEAGVPLGAVRVGRAMPRAAGTPSGRNGRRAAGLTAPRLARTTLGRQGIRIETDVPGVVEVQLSDLYAQGLPTGQSLSLWNKGRPVSYQMVSGGAVLRFTAEPLATDYSGANVYVLTWGEKPFGVSVALSDSGDRSRPGFARAERDMLYLASSPVGADPWLWDLLVSNGTEWPYPEWDPNAEFGLFDLPGWVAPRPRVPVRIRLVGYTDHTHTVSAKINGASVGSVTFFGATEALIEGTIDAGSLRRTGNRLTLVATAREADGQSTPDARVYLDYVDVAKAPSSPGAGRVSGLSPYSGALPDARGVDYLIVTHPQFRPAAERIAAQKTADGLKTEIVETDALYDRYSGGITEANAVRAGIRYLARQSRRLKYLLLLGDDTYDARNAYGLDSKVFVPSLYARDQGFGRIPSENLYADLNDDGRPDLAVGRFTAQTTAEAMVFADKVENQQAALEAFSGAQIFATDDRAAVDDAPFRQEAGEMAALSGASLGSVTFADVAEGIDGARSSLLGAWRSGVSQVNYFGHGGPELWADDGLFTTGDVSSGLKPALVFMWACESQDYQYFSPSLGEALMLAPNAGAIASFGPTGIAAPASQRVLYEKVYGRMLEGDATLGEIIRRAKSEALDERAISADVVFGFNLLGDPALRIPRRPQD